MSAVPVYQARGLRLNNPGCIRRSATSWAGQAAVQTDPDFVTFIAPEWGIRAMVRILDSYQREGVETVQGVISRWSPPSDNNPTDVYIANVCKACSVEPTTVILLSSHLEDLVKAITTQECGSWPYDNATLQLGVSLARTE